MLLGRDLQDGGDGLHVGVDGVADHLGDELVDQDDGDIGPSQEAPAERDSPNFFFSTFISVIHVRFWFIHQILFIYQNLRSLD